MNSLIRAAAWLLLPLAGLALATLPPLAPPRWQTAASLPCAPEQPRLWMNGKAVPLGRNETAVGTNGTIFQQICQPGTLVFTARGTPVDGRFPLLSVSVGSETLLSTEVNQEQTYRIRVPHVGLLNITFHNDAYRPEDVPPQDRNLFLRDVKYTSE